MTFNDWLADQGRYSITENTAGTWSYHLSSKENPHEALCGERVMSTSIPVGGWGKTDGDLPSSFCEECEALALKTYKNSFNQ